MCFTWQLFSLFGTSPPSFPNLLHFLSLLERTCCCCCCFYYCCYGGGSVLHTTAISASLFPLCDRRKSSRSSFCIPFLVFSRTSLLHLLYCTFLFRAFFCRNTANLIVCCLSSSSSLSSLSSFCSDHCEFFGKVLSPFY